MRARPFLASPLGLIGAAGLLLQPARTAAQAPQMETKSAASVAVPAASQPPAVGLPPTIAPAPSRAAPAPAPAGTTPRQRSTAADSAAPPTSDAPITAGAAAAVPPSPDAASAIAAWAGPPEPTGLPQLLQHAVTHLPALARARIDLDIATAQMALATARNDWQLAADLNVQSNRTLLAGRSGRTTRIALTGSMQKSLYTGGALSIDSTTSVSDQNFDAFAGRQWAQQVTATLSQPLLRGRGQALAYIDRRRAEVEASRVSAVQRGEAVTAVQNVVAAYWDVVLAQAEADIARSSLALANERLRVTQVAIRGGKLAPNEDLAVLQAIATREEEVLAAELAIVTRSIGLRRIAGLPIAAGALSLRVEGAIPAPALTERDLTKLLAKAMQASPELARLTTVDAAAGLDFEVAQNGLLPQLDAAITLGPTGTGAAALDAYKNLVTDPGIVVAGTLTYRQALGAQAARAQQRITAHTREKLRLTSDDVRAQLAQTLTVALGQVELAALRSQLADRALALTTQNIANETARVTLGKSTNFDVLQRQEEQKAAQLRKVRALIDGQKAIAAVHAITGDLLLTYGIDASR